MVSRWRIYQGTILITLFILAFIADMSKNNFFTHSSQNPFVQSLLSSLFIAITLGLFSLFLFFQTKESQTFLIHPVWGKMHIIVLALLFLSVIIFISLVLFSPLASLVEGSRWIFYIIFYYFLFLSNVLVLSIIHINNKRLENQKKIRLSFIWTLLILLLVIFLLPGL